MWTYHIAEHYFDKNGVEQDFGHCYAGLGDCKNDPSKCHEKGRGPIPPGKYRIGSPMNDPGGTGPFSLPLEPLPGTDTFGRSGFRIHGDSVNHPGEASHGCPVAPLALRKEIDASNDRTLAVVP